MGVRSKENVRVDLQGGLSQAGSLDCEYKSREMDRVTATVGGRSKASVDRHMDHN